MNIEGISRYKILFWDFDGVIKESVEIKAQAFRYLFVKYGQNVTNKVLEHHLSNSGMSRFKKIPLYLRWAGESVDCRNVNRISHEFGQIVLQKVIESPWVPGVESFLRDNPYNQKHNLVSATPLDELIYITRALVIQDCFDNIYGSPMDKCNAIHRALKNYNTNPGDCLMIGDAKADLEAAMVNCVPFLLRINSSNKEMFFGYKGETINNFLIG